MTRLLTCIATFVFLVSPAWAVTPMTWGSGVNASNTSGKSSYSSRIAASSDTLHATWWETIISDAPPGAVYYKRSLDGGATWRDQYTLSTALAYGVVPEVVASGNVVNAFWVDQASGQYVLRSARSTDAGVTWSAAQDLTPVSASIKNVNPASEGQRIAVIWAEVSGSTFTVKMRVSSDQGATWATATNVVTYTTNPTEAVGLDVAIANSVVVVGYIDGAPWTVRTIRSADWGQTWSSSVAVYTSPSYYVFNLRLASYGSSVVSFWGQYISSYNYPIYSAASADGGASWSSPAQLDAGDVGADYQGDICIWGNRAVAVWLYQPGGTTTLKYRRSLDGGLTWEPITPIATPGPSTPSCFSSANSVYVTGYYPYGPGQAEIYVYRGNDPPGTPVYNQSYSALSFGSATVGSSGTATFTVSNTGTAALNVTGITVSGTDAAQFAVSPTTFTVDAGAAAQTVAVTFAPTSAGTKSAALSIAHNAVGSPSTVTLSGTGVPLPAPAFFTSLGTWSKHAANPVLTGSPGQFDGTWINRGAVLYEDNTYKMWYGGGLYGSIYARTGYATSGNGTEWTRSGVVLDTGAGWDRQAVFFPSVLKDGGVYKMWYTGAIGSSWVMDIGYATSPDGQTWTKYSGNPVFLGSSLGSQFEAYVGTVLKEGGTYKMWYSAISPSVPYHVRLATSPDGITWTDRGQVLGAGVPGAWDGILWPFITVVKKGDLYEMWYTGGNSSGVYAIGHATSADGITWSKSPYNPVLNRGSAGSWESAWVGVSAALVEGETPKMWYMGDDGSMRRLGYATHSASLDFGHANLGSSVTRSFTVSNAGTAPLEIWCALSGTDAAHFDVAPDHLIIHPGHPPQTVTVTFTPTSPGAKSASLSLSHNAAGSPSSAALTGTGLNQPPVANNDVATTTEDATVDIAVMANDSDPNGDGLTLTSVGAAAHGSAVGNPDGTITYTPNSDFNGADSFTYTLSDGHGGTATATVNVTVNPVNDPPVLTALTPQTVDEGQPLALALAALDPDSPVALSVAGAPTGASLMDNHDGTATFTWTPGYDQAGIYTLSFTASDGSLSDSKDVTITVNNVTRTLTASAGAGGTINPVGAQVVDYGSNQTFAIAADAGYRIEDVLVDGVSVGAIGTYTFSNVTANHTISASFAIDTFTLTATAGAGGTITPAGVTTVTYGSSHSFAIAPNAGYSIADVLVDGASIGPLDTYTFTDVIANHTISASFADIAPPVLTLSGANPLLLELGTAYPEPGATASDLADGDLTGNIQISGGVNSDTEGSYTLTYTVSDAAGNTASATRAVQVVVTPNSYGLIATHSMHLRSGARINSGFAGVVERGQAPFLAGKVELVVGTRVQTGPEVRLSAPRVRVRDHASIAGTLVYTELTSVGRRATIAQQTQVPASYFPLFQGFGLPTFQSGTPGTREVEVRPKGSAALSAGAYDEVRVNQKGTLTFTGGTYQLADLEVGQQAKVVFLAPTVLLIKGQLFLGQRSSFGPGAGLDASDILVYVEGRNGRLGSSHDNDEGDDEEDDAEGRRLRQSPRSVKVGEEARFQGNLYVPNGTVHLRQGSMVVGSVIARDLIVGVRVQVAAQSGWNTPGVIYQPQAPAAAAKLAGEPGQKAVLPAGTGLLANYPNPFNPSTTIPYVLSEAGVVKLSVYNVLGQQVRALVDQLQAPGSYAMSWDGRDAVGIQVAGGVYFCRLEAGQQVQVRKMLLAK